jgi:hypothetical protein
LCLARSLSWWYGAGMSNDTTFHVWDDGDGAWRYRLFLQGNAYENGHGRTQGGCLRDLPALMRDAGIAECRVVLGEPPIRVVEYQDPIDSKAGLGPSMLPADVVDHILGARGCPADEQGLEDPRF